MYTMLRGGRDKGVQRRSNIEGQTYDAIRGSFEWRIPKVLNIGTICADRHPSGSLAMVEILADGTRREYTFGELAMASNRLANALAGLGISEGDRVAIVLPQRFETGVSHIALYKMGAIAVPMSTLFGPEALVYRLHDCGAAAVITDEGSIEVVSEAARELESLKIIVVGKSVRSPHQSFADLLASASSSYQINVTGPDTPALIIYTSGTTGPPKGAVHGHRVLLGHLPGFELSHNRFPQMEDRFWTPADWSWIGGLMDCLMPSWYHGVPVVAAPRRGFDPEWAIDLIRKEQVRNTFLPPTALKLLREAGVELLGFLRSVMSGGEALGVEMLEWGRTNLGVVINEIYGQTEANYVVGNSAMIWPVHPGSMGRAYPGHQVVVLNPSGEEVRAGVTGEFAVRVPDPVVFLGYWGRETETEEKVHNGWLYTGDAGYMTEEGYLFFSGRVDDVINSAGYRIGPSEIEDCLLGHPAVAMAAVIGVPDDLRGEAIKAFIVLKEGYESSSVLEDQIRQHVRERLATYEYPRQIEFANALPMTTTGKVRRSELRRIEAERRANAGH